MHCGISRGHCEWGGATCLPDELTEHGVMFKMNSKIQMGCNSRKVHWHSADSAMETISKVAFLPKEAIWDQDFANNMKKIKSYYKNFA